jgi:hypothetical protein
VGMIARQGMYKILVLEPLGKQSVLRLKSRWKGNIKMNYYKLVCECGDLVKVYHLQILTCTSSVTSISCTVLILVLRNVWSISLHSVAMYFLFVIILLTSALVIKWYVCLRLFAQSSVMSG